MEQSSTLQKSLVNETQPMGGVVNSVTTSHSQVSNNTFALYLCPTASSSTSEMQITVPSKDNQFNSNPSVVSENSMGLLTVTSVQQTPSTSNSLSDVSSTAEQVNESLGMPTQVIDSLRQDQLSLAGVSTVHDGEKMAAVNLISTESMDASGSLERLPIGAGDPSATTTESSSDLEFRHDVSHQSDVGLNMQQIGSLELPTEGNLGQQSLPDSGDLAKPVSDTQSPNTSSRSLRTKRSFTTEFKLECVEHAERTKNKTKTAKLFNVNRRRVQEWCTQKERLMAVPKQQKRLSGGGRRQIPLTPSPQILLAEQEGVAGVRVVDDKEKGVCSVEDLNNTAPQGFAFPVAAPVDPAFVDFIMQNLPSMDFSTLPNSMVKVFQDWSKLTSQAGKIPSGDKGVSQDPNMDVQAPVPPHPECDTEDEIDVGGAMESATSESVFPALATEKPETEAFDSQAELPNYTIAEQHDSEEPLQVSHSDMVQSGTECVRGEDGAEPVSGQASTVSNNEEEIRDATHLLTGTPPIDQKITIDLNSLTAWIQENALESNVPAILDALLQAQTAPTKPPVETPMEVALDPGTTSQKIIDKKPDVIHSPSIPRARVKNRYSLDFKLSCIAHAESTSKCAAAREFNVDRRRVQDWCSKKEQLQKMVQVSGQTVVKLSRERIDQDVEQDLVAWVKFQQDAGVVLNRKMLGDEATKLYHEKGETDFVSSVGWVAKFMVRNNISLVGRSLRIKPPPETETMATS